MKQTTLYHPAFGTPAEVDPKQVDEWVDQGWRKTPPTEVPAAATAADKPGDDKKGTN